ncbi:nitrous oxide-stimulated promoter family protein [uncultured Anaerococcus sp.]|uniref:nitrous oxide-stimulated promoter family protein n=1 Tax=uncultured Anaerococcus sp. TaxID=293428 RepID=UPI00288B2031|nr:nitrous oxide-stimulated promoter family protein [uncultured Anaerococcus sp.]
MKKSDRGKGLVDFMIDLYYDRHKSEDIKKENLKAYVAKKLRACPHGDTKPFCSSCKIHCYDDDHRKMIKKVMRYSGPRMVFHAPIQALRHLLESKRRS